MEIQVGDRFRRPHVSVGVLMLNEKGEILLGLRKGDLGSGEWSLPAGHVEFGETIFEAALREVKEETDISASEPQLISVADEMYGEKQYLGLGVSAQYNGGAPKLMEPDKCGEWRWFDLSVLPHNLFKATKLVIRNYLSQEIYRP